MVKKMKQGIMRWQRGVIVACFAIMIIIITGVTTYAATTPTAKVVTFSNGATNIRSSQLLEVKTSGFPKNAILNYKYTNNALSIEAYGLAFFAPPVKYTTGARVIICQNISDAYKLNITDSNCIDNGESFSSKSPLFAIGNWNRCVEGNLSIEVTAENYPELDPVIIKLEGNFPDANMASDMNSGAGAMFVGENLDLREIMATAGMPCTGATMKMDIIRNDGYALAKNLKFIKTFDGLTLSQSPLAGGKPDSSAYHYRFKASKSGSATVSFSYKLFNDLITLSAAAYYSPSGVNDKNKGYPDYYQDYQFDFYVFDKPVVISGLKTITLIGTKAGVTYTLGDESFYCSQDNQKIVFGNDFGDGLFNPDQEYKIMLSKNVSGKTAKIFMNAKTSSVSYINFDTNGVPSTNYTSSTSVSYNKQNLSAYRATADGYDFLGWNEKPDGSGKNYSQEVVDKEYLTVYAQWKARVYNVKVDAQLNKTTNPNLTIDLYQDNKLVYNLKYDTSSKSYINNAIVYNPTNNKYDIYLNGKNYGKQIKFTGKESDGTGVSEIVNQYMYTVDFYLRTDDAAKPLNNEKVQLYKDNKYYDLTYKETKGTTSTYSLNTTYNEQDITKDGPYYIYLNNSIVQKNGIAKEFSISNDTSLNNLTFDFYSVSFEVKKDNQYWGDEASIIIKDQDGLKYNMTYNSTSHKYETQGILDLGQSYKVYISGIQSREDIDQVLNISQKTGSIDYYTVEFKDAEKTYETVVVEKGQCASKPPTPIKSGNTFVYWCDNADGSGDRYFQNGSTLTPDITKKTTFYATWKKPSVALGTYIKCDSDGTQNGSGKYYRLDNLSIIGFPEGGTSAPIRTAVFKLTEDSDINSKITVIGTNSNVSVTGNGTKNLKVVFKKGVSMKDAEEFLRTKIIVQPDTIKKGRKHTLNVSVFGVTG